MAASITCPLCGHTCRLPLQEMKDGQARCTGCFNLFPMPAAAAGPSLLARAGAKAAPPPVPGDAPNRTMLAQAEPMIRYNCPRCKKPLESPASLAGQKLNCPDCNQRLQIPRPAAPPPPPINKTILAVEEGAPQAQPAPPPAPAAKRPADPPMMDVLEVIDEPPSRSAPAGRREACLECGVDLTQQSRVQTCPNCGSLFCSARCFREHNLHAHAPRRAQPPPPPEIHYHAMERRRPEGPKTGMATAGLVLGTIAILLAFIPCVGWIGFLLGILGTVFSGVGLANASKHDDGKGMAATGLVLSILAIIAVPIMVVVWIAAFH